MVFRVTKEILSISNPSFKNIPSTTIEDTARRRTRPTSIAQARARKTASRTTTRRTTPTRTTTRRAPTPTRRTTTRVTTSRRRTAPTSVAAAQARKRAQDAARARAAAQAREAAQAAARRKALLAEVARRRAASQAAIKAKQEAAARAKAAEAARAKSLAQQRAKEAAAERARQAREAANIKARERSNFGGFGSKAAQDAALAKAIADQKAKEAADKALAARVKQATETAARRQREAAAARAKAAAEAKAAAAAKAKEAAEAKAAADARARAEAAKQPTVGGPSFIAGVTTVGEERVSPATGTITAVAKPSKIEQEPLQHPITDPRVSPFLVEAQAKAVEEAKPVKTKEQLREELLDFRGGSPDTVALADASGERVREGISIFDQQQFARGGVEIEPDSLEGRVIERVFEEQDVKNIANVAQADRFKAITGAKTGVEALEIAEKTAVPEVFFTFGGEEQKAVIPETGEEVTLGGDTRGFLDTDEGREVLEQRLGFVPRPSVQESLTGIAPETLPVKGAAQKVSKVVQIATEPVAVDQAVKPTADFIGPPTLQQVQALDKAGSDFIGQAAAPAGLVSVKRKDGSVIQVKPETAEKLAARGQLQQPADTLLDSEQLQKAGVPLIPGAAGLLGGVSTIPFQSTQAKNPTEGGIFSQNLFGEDLFGKPVEGPKPTLEGFRTPASEARAAALDLTPVVLEQTRTDIPGETITSIIPAGTPTKRTFVDPKTGKTVTETVQTLEGQQVVTVGGGFEIKEKTGPSIVVPDFSDPFGSLFKGASQSLANEVIGIKNIASAGTGLATGGLEGAGAAPQEEFFATPSSILLGGAIDVGRELFTGGDAFGKGNQVLQTLDRTVRADPLFALGDIAVQIPLLVVAPVKAVTTAARVGSKTISAVGKATKIKPKIKQKVAEIKTKRQEAAALKRQVEAEKKEPLSKKIRRQEQLQTIDDPAAIRAVDDVLAPKQATRPKIKKPERTFQEQAIDLGLVRGASPLKGTRSLVGITEEVDTGKVISGLGGAPRIKPKGTRTTPEALITPRTETAVSPKATTTTRFPEVAGAERAVDSRFRDALGIGIKVQKGERLTGPEAATALQLQTGRVRRALKAEEEGPAGLIGGIVDPKTGFVQRFGRFGDETLGEVPRKPPSGPKAPPTKPSKPTFTQKNVDELAERGAISKKAARDVLEDQANKAAKTGDESTFRALKSSKALDDLADDVQKLKIDNAEIRSLGRLKTVLQKQKQGQKVSSKVEQQTQKKIRDLIKKDKIQSPEKLTQSKLRNLIKQERVTIGIKALGRGGAPGKALSKGITRRTPPPVIPKIKTPTVPKVPKPRKGSDLVQPKPKTGRTGKIIGGGLGAAIAGGLLLSDPGKPVEATRKIIQPDTISIQQPKIRSILTQPEQEIIKVKQPQRFRTGVAQVLDLGGPPKTKTTTTQRFNQQLRQDQLTGNILLQQQLFGRRPRFGAAGRVDEPKTTRQRRFFRVFDVAKTPFGRVSRGLGVQVQAGRAIFEVEDVLGKKRGKSVSENFFDF